MLKVKEKDESENATDDYIFLTALKNLNVILNQDTRTQKGNYIDDTLVKCMLIIKMVQNITLLKNAFIQSLTEKQIKQATNIVFRAYVFLISNNYRLNIINNVNIGSNNYYIRGYVKKIMEEYHEKYFKEWFEINDEILISPEITIGAGNILLRTGGDADIAGISQRKTDEWKFIIPVHTKKPLSTNYLLMKFKIMSELVKDNDENNNCSYYDIVTIKKITKNEYEKFKELENSKNLSMKL